jgi:hypothetical protein
LLPKPTAAAPPLAKVPPLARIGANLAAAAPITAGKAIMKKCTISYFMGIFAAGIGAASQSLVVMLLTIFIGEMIVVLVIAPKHQ